jgi:integrase
VSRRQLPPQIKKLEVTERGTGKRVVRYQVTVDTGVNPRSGKRQQARRRYASEREARLALAELIDTTAQGRFVPKASLTVEQVCADYISGRHSLRATSLSKLEYDLAPLRQRHGNLPVQRLSKAHLDALVVDLKAGGTVTANERVRRPWSAGSVNKMVATVEQVLADAVKQGLLVRNVAALVDRLEPEYKPLNTFTEAEVTRLLGAVAGDRLAHAWELALCGLRRGEIAGLRWADVDLKAQTLSISNNRVSAGGRTTEGEPKSKTSRRELPLPDRLVAVLKAAKACQAGERLALGVDYPGLYVVCNEIGDPYSPAVLSRYWRDALKAAGIRHIKLHAARHTCATLMHLQGVPVAVIAAWIGHKDASTTMKIYAHSQGDALKAAGASLNRVVTTRDTQSR